MELSEREIRTAMLRMNDESFSDKKRKDIELILDQTNIKNEELKNQFKEFKERKENNDTRGTQG